MADAPALPAGIQPAAGNVNLGVYDLDDAIVQQQFLQVAAGYTALRFSGSIDSVHPWDTFSGELTELGAEVLLEAAHRFHETALLRLETKAGATVVLVGAATAYGEYNLTVAGENPKAAQAALTALTALLPPRPASTSDQVDLTFWFHHPMAGAVSRRRPIDRLSWEQVSRNYPAAIRPALDQLTALTGPPPGGRLFVFHGPPGTGKTRLTQTLADAWVDWCDIHYIVDADMMLREALYLNTVVIDGDRDPDRWRLLVLEDGDEFVDSHAKHAVGQGVSRLLNTADGLLGQGLKVMILVSTNVNSLRFSSAVVRTGRCGALINFPPFTAEEGEAWLADAGVEPDPDRPLKKPTLAELYERLHPDGGQTIRAGAEIEVRGPQRIGQQTDDD